MAKKKTKKQARERTKLPDRVKTAVLTEAGYRCALPTCRQILALDLHHMWEVSAGGSDDPSNLIALCPTCHALYHRKKISAEAIYSYKAMLVALSRGFDVEAVDKLLFLSGLEPDFLVVSGDGALHFGRLIAAGLASIELKANNNWQVVSYAVNISEKGSMLIDAWKAGDRARLASVISGPVIAPELADTGASLN